MKKLQIRATVKVERTESGGKARERVVLTPVIDERSKLGPPDSLVLTVDDANQIGTFDGVTEVDIEVTPVEGPDEPAAKKHKKD